MSSGENSSTVPAPDDDPIVSAGLEIAMKWGQALGGPEQLKVALEALEPQLKREHQLHLKQLDIRAKQAERRYQHRFRMTSLIVGAVMSVAMLSGGVYVAKDAWWLSTLLCGPSMIGMALIIILRRHDANAMKAISEAARRSTDAVGQAQPPVV
ncbi:hypothetical protein QCN29_05135 [Streptomyces sp. HNM0663]|uniref:DUF2335 domain-containing protein n=1 Tax=Streptomyces chengmaiensis TaxID=3040919 RepID=A0ABT6HHF2_9ACTN|nr:hypothetical protein [Streptomyces chengmaiensis]MDH2388183.1 hypothetical protein [Streptomyces chengmaiensis]